MNCIKLILKSYTQSVSYEFIIEKIEKPPKDLIASHYLKNY